MKLIAEVFDTVINGRVVGRTGDLGSNIMAR
jgi:hypothetical protein